MSKNAPPKPRVTSPDGATVTGDMTLTGIVRTTKGFALAIATITAEGVKVELGGSQAFKEHIAILSKRASLAQALKA